ncbi:hypothetical protein LTR95_005056 [Oleoguttula sp. CCFEE 5521]
MDPFFLTAGIVGIADAGTSLASFLTTKYKSYTNAPKLLQDLAQEVDFCVGWVGVLGNRLEERDNGGYSVKFAQDASNLTGKIFDEIQALIPEERDLGNTFSRGKWKFVLNEKKLTAAQERLRRKQHMFMFMDSMYRASTPSTSASAGKVGQGLGGLRGPLELSGFDAQGRRYEVKMSVAALPELMPMSRSRVGEAIGGSRNRKSEMRVKMVEEQRLKGLAQSPLFDANFLRGNARAKASAGLHSHQGDDRIEIIETRMKRTAVEADHKPHRTDGPDVDHGSGTLAAELEVEDLKRRWFGPDEQDDPEPEGLTFDPPGSTTGHASRYGIEESSYRPQPPSPVQPAPSANGRYSVASDLPGVDSSLRHHSDSTSSGTHKHIGAEPPRRTSRRVTCDGCDRKIDASEACMRCSQCPQGRESFDLCVVCYTNPVITLRHSHAKRDFVKDHGRHPNNP